MANKLHADTPKRKKKRLLREQVYNGIKDAIINGELEPGRRLIEEKLAEDMNTSRTPVREAIQKLEKEGLIKRLPRGGFVVRGVTEEEVEEVFGIRGVLEGYAGFLATSRIKEEELKTLNQIIKLEEACLANMNTEEFIRLDSEFHDVLYRPQLAVKDHKEMVSSLKAKNARQVEKLVRKHMTRGKDLIKKKIRQGQEVRIV
jgi:DNA-binding GntR family transcriptional regulator